MMRRLVPAGLLVAAAIAGLLAGLLSALADGSPGRPAPAARSAVDVPVTTGPLRTSLPGVAAPGPGDRLPTTYPRRAGRDTRVVARAADPYGGPEWAVRTFTRTIRVGPERPAPTVVQTCAQVGRILGGRFVWIHPHLSRARAVPVDTTDTTVCTGRGRTAVLGALRLPAAAVGGSNPQISATVVWGVTPKPRTRVALRSPEASLELLALRGGTRLRVVRGDVDLGRRTVVADGRPVEAGIDNAQYLRPMFTRGRPRVPRRGTKPEFNVVVTAGLRVAGVVADPSADRPSLVATTVDPATGAPCYVILDRLVDGEPVRTAGPTGALESSSALCQPAYDVPPGGWIGLNGGGSSGGEEHAAEGRRGRELRTLPGSSTQAWAFPGDVVEVDVEDPLGVRTVRTVPLGRVSIVVVRRAGDLPVSGLDFGAGQRRVFTGRRADGSAVTLRHHRPG